MNRPSVLQAACLEAVASVVWFVYPSWWPHIVSQQQLLTNSLKGELVSAYPSQTLTLTIRAETQNWIRVRREKAEDFLTVTTVILEHVDTNN